MKILCLSDYEDPFIYSQGIKKYFNDVELILSSGDLDLEYYDYISSTLNKTVVFVFGNHNLKEIKNYSRRYKNEKESIFNGNKAIIDFYSEPDKIHKNEIDIDYNKYSSVYVGGRIKKIKGIIIAGLGGTMKYNNSKNQFTEIGMFFYLLKLIPKMLFNKIIHGRYLDILLTHAPPRGIHDKLDKCHKGFKVFLWFMKVFKPRYLVHGHIHIYNLNEPRITKYHSTTVVNAFKYIVIDL